MLAELPLLAFGAARDWSALGTMLLGLGAIFAGLWALFNYHKNRRAEAAQWLQAVFRDFYLGYRFQHIKLMMEYEYTEKLAPLLERRLTDRAVPVTAAERKLLDQLDMLLNYFEYVIYLEREGHFKRRDRQAVFEYWFDLLAADERAAARRYVASFGFERVTSALKLQKDDYVALYGSLMRDEEAEDKPDVSSHVDFVGEATLRGDLYDLGDYPGLVPGRGSVRAELFKLKDREALAKVDRFERYDAGNREQSLYIRRLVRMANPQLDAWVYVYNGDVSSAHAVKDGDWRRRQQGRDPGTNRATTDGGSE